MSQGSGRRGRPTDNRVPTQDEYEAETAETRWVQLQDFDGAFEVREVPPLRLLRDMKKYGVAGLLKGDADADVEELVVSDGFSEFLENTVLPNIVQPTCYWDFDADDREEIGSGDFDLAALTADDLFTVITGLTGQDTDDLEGQMEDTFRG